MIGVVVVVVVLLSSFRAGRWWSIGCYCTCGGLLPPLEGLLPLEFVAILVRFAERAKTVAARRHYYILSAGSRSLPARAAVVDGESGHGGSWISPGIWATISQSHG